jgi:DNA-binding SARP family transcriptional activator
MMKYGVLGPIVVSGARPVTFRPRERAIFALLLLNHGHVLPVSRMVDELWPDCPPDSANNLVQQYVSRIRRQLRLCGESSGAASLQTREPGYLLNCDGAELDAVLFETALDDARRALATGRHSDAVRLLNKGLGLWRGTPLLDVQRTPSVAAEADRLEEQRLQAIEERLDAELALGRHLALVSELTALVAVNPFRERMRGQLMLTLYRCGRQVEALELYRATRRIMMAEFGVEPGYALRRLERDILNSAAELAVPARTALTLRKDIPAQLPFCIRDFTGRAREVAYGCHVLRSEQRPPGRNSLAVLKIVGKPGVGKTTLAVQIAHRLRHEFPDGQLFVNLRGMDVHPRDPARVLGRFLRTLGMAATDLPGTVEERHEHFLTLTADRRILVVLDNCADEAQVRPLLPGSAGCGVIMTSRRSLAALEGACHLVVEPFGSEEAAELLSRIADSNQPAHDAQGTAEVVRLCGYLPLAIRIAGSKLTVRPSWTLRGLADRLQTSLLDELTIGDLGMRASIAPSYESLGPAARTAFRRLGLLNSSEFDRWTCAAVTGEGITRAEQLLDHLAQQHLLETAPAPGGQVRYFFDDMLRAFARERARLEGEHTGLLSAVDQAAQGEVK